MCGILGVKIMQNYDNTIIFILTKAPLRHLLIFTNFFPATVFEDNVSRTYILATVFILLNRITVWKAGRQQTQEINIVTGEECVVSASCYHRKWRCSRDG